MTSALLAAALLYAGPPSAGAGAQGIDFLDQEGRAVTLDAPAERVVPLPTPAASMLATVAESAQPIAAMSADSRRAIAEGPLGVWMPPLLAVPTAAAGRNGQANLEELLRLNPDLVLQWSNRGGDALAQLERAGLKIAALRYGSEEDVVAWLTLMGAALGKPERAAALIAWRNRWRGELETSLGGLAEAEKPRVLYILRGRAGLQVAGSGTYNHFSIGLAGGRNVAADLADFRAVTPEQILAWSPDVIVLGSFETELTPAWLARQPGLSGVKAVREGRVYATPIGGYRWDPPSQESPLFWLWLARKLHPDRVTAPLEPAMQEAAALLYGAALTPAMQQRILRDGSGDARAEALR
jgi:iron complex transport system substrate-binding protein